MAVHGAGDIQKGQTIPLNRDSLFSWKNTAIAVGVVAVGVLGMMMSSSMNTELKESYSLGPQIGAFNQTLGVGNLHFALEAQPLQTNFYQLVNSTIGSAILTAISRGNALNKRWVADEHMNPIALYKDSTCWPPFPKNADKAPAKMEGCFDGDVIAPHFDEEGFFEVADSIADVVRVDDQGQPQKFGYLLQYLANDPLEYENTYIEQTYTYDGATHTIKVIEANTISREIEQQISTLSFQKMCFLAQLIGISDQHGNNVIRKNDQLIPVDFDEAFSGINLVAHIRNPEAPLGLSLINLSHSPFWKFNSISRMKVSEPVKDEIKEYLQRYDSDRIFARLVKAQAIHETKNASLKDGLYIFSTYLKYAINHGKTLWDCYKYRIDTEGLKRDLQSVFFHLNQTETDFLISPDSNQYDHDKLRSAFRFEFEKIMSERFGSLPS